MTDLAYSSMSGNTSIRFAAYSMLVSCGAPMIAAGVPAEALAVSAPADGWATVREPGWFHADFPSPPRVSLEWDRTHQGRYQYKQLLAETRAVLIAVHYVEYGDAIDFDEAKSTMHGRLTHPSQSGIHVVSTSPVTIGSGIGDQMVVRVDPSSETNAAPVPLDERVLFVSKDHRVFQIQCAAPADKFVTCERFLASFEIE